MATSPARILEDLGAHLDGELVLPGQPRWDDARRAWQLTVDQQPAAVVEAASVDDVVKTVRTAATVGLRVAPQTTGHNASPLGSLDSTILLRTRGLREVAIDADGMTARVGAGAVWNEVVEPAAAHGLAALAGTSPNVGVVGYTLGGGIGWFARSHGLASRSVTAMEVVDSSGDVRRIDTHHDADLFWALRGGGGDVAIVTAIEFRLYPIREVYAGTLVWPIERAAQIVEAWRRWILDVPPTVTSLSRILRYPLNPDMPPFLQGRSFVSIEFAMQEDTASAERLLNVFRALQPEIDTGAVTPVSQLGALHGDPPMPVPAYGRSAILTELSSETVEAFVASAGDEASAPLLSVELRHLGGALSPHDGEDGALDGLRGSALLFAVGITPTPEARDAVSAAATRVIASVDPWRSSWGYSNFVEDPQDSDVLYGGSTERLRRVKAAHDPADLISSNHPVS